VDDIVARAERAVNKVTDKLISSGAWQAK